MCIYGSSSVKPSSQKSLATYSQSYQDTTLMKIKIQRLQYEMWKLKERDERKQTLDARIYPVVRIGTKTLLYPCCWSTHEEYRFPAIKSLPWTQSRSPWSRFSLRELVHEGGVSVPRTMSSTPLHTKPEGRWLTGEPPIAPRGQHTVIQVWFTLELATRISTLLVHSLKS